MTTFRCILAAACSLLAAASKPDEPNDAKTPTADSMVGEMAGEVRDDNCLQMKLVWCPSGIFSMEKVVVVEEPAAKDQSSDKPDDDSAVDEPAPQSRATKRIVPVKVFLSRGFWLGQYEVTQSDWRQVISTEPWKGQGATSVGDDCPATFVSWDDALEFCRKLTEREHSAGRLPQGWEYTLPTEAQWEHGCRARTETSYSFGDDESQLGDYAWYRGNAGDAGEKYVHPIGQKKPNPWGLFDMHGNAWEWCRDSYADDLPGGRDPEVSQHGSNQADRESRPRRSGRVSVPAGKMGSNAVYRGGGWGALASDCR